MRTKSKCHTILTSQCGVKRHYRETGCSLFKVRSYFCIPLSRLQKTSFSSFTEHNQPCCKIGVYCHTHVPPGLNTTVSLCGLREPSPPSLRDAARRCRRPSEGRISQAGETCAVGQRKRASLPGGQARSPAAFSALTRTAVWGEVR